MRVRIDAAIPGVAWPMSLAVGGGAATYRSGGGRHDMQCDAGGLAIHAAGIADAAVDRAAHVVERRLMGIEQAKDAVAPALGHRAAISHLFLALGVVTAVVGALFCFRERSP